MSGVLEADIKENAVNNFIRIVTANNHKLGEQLSRNRGVIFSKAIANIQRIGVTDYARQVLRRTSDERYQLLDEIERIMA